jgi:hypothetical protein
LVSFGFRRAKKNCREPADNDGSNELIKRAQEACFKPDAMIAAAVGTESLL